MGFLDRIREREHVDSPRSPVREERARSRPTKQSSSIRAFVHLVVVVALAAVGTACDSRDDNHGDAPGGNVPFGVHASLERVVGACPGAAAADELEFEGSGINEGDCLIVTRSPVTSANIQSAVAEDSGSAGWTVTITFDDQGEAALEELAAANAGTSLVVRVGDYASEVQSTSFFSGSVALIRLDEDEARRLVGLLSPA
jgi:hypothetical protein